MEAEWAISAVEEIGLLGGSEGCSDDSVNSVLQQLGRKYPLELTEERKNRLCLLIQQHPAICSVGGKYVCNEDYQRHFLTGGKAIHLSEISFRALEMIGRAGEAGVAQSDLARKLSLDSRTLFHHLKPLIRHELIVRIPVTFKKSFTYLCVLERYEDEEINVVGDREGRWSKSAEMKGKILDIIAAAPAKTLPSTSVFAQLRLGRQHIKAYRRLIWSLAKSGHLEYVNVESRELGGPKCKILRFKQPFAVERAEKPEKRVAEAFGKMASAGISLEQQVRDHIHSTGRQGITLSRLGHLFGLSTKLAYRIYQKLCEPKMAVSNSDVIKVSEFRGRERHHRLFTKTGVEMEPAIASTPTTLQRDSITRQHRQDLILQILRDATILEVGKGLAVQVQNHLQSSYQLDAKTLKRTVLSMEATGLLRTITVALPSGMSRLLAIRNDADVNDDRVAAFMSKFKETRALPSAEKKQQSEATVYRRNPAVFGYIYGCMARCRVLHLFLFSAQGHSIFETVDVLFRKLPLKLFLQLIGIWEFSPALKNVLEDPSLLSVPLEQLEAFEEINQRRGHRHRIMMRKMLQTLVDLGLLIPDNQFPSVEFRIAFQHRLNTVAYISSSVFNLDSESSVADYWAKLKNSECAEIAQRTRELISVPENWLEKHPVTTKIRKRIKKLVEGEETVQEVDQELQKLAGDFGMSMDDIRLVFNQIGSEVLNKTLPQAKKPRMSVRKRRKEKFHMQHWTLEQMRQAQVLIVLLHQPFLFKNSVSWSKASNVIEGQSSSSSIRHYCCKVLMGDYNQFKSLLQLEKRLVSVDLEALCEKMSKAELIRYCLSIDTISYEYDTDQSLLWISWNRIKHSRKTRFALFADIKATVSRSSVAGETDEAVSRAIRMVKMALASGDPQPLRLLDSNMYDRAIEQMIQMGLITRATRNRRRFVPGTDWVASDSLCALIDAEPMIKQGDLEGKVISEKGAFEIDLECFVQGVALDELSIDENFKITRAPSVSSSVPLKTSEALMFSQIDGAVNAKIFNNCRGLIERIIKKRPGISHERLLQHCAPVLDKYEVEYCLSCLPPIAVEKIGSRKFYHS